MLKITLPRRMIEIFLGYQQSTPDIARQRAHSAVTVAWHFKLCLEDQLGHTPVFLNNAPPAVQIRGLVRSSPQFLVRHQWITATSLPQHEAGMWLRPGEPRVPKSVMTPFTKQFYQTCFFLHWIMLRPSSSPLPRKWVLVFSSMPQMLLALLNASIPSSLLPLSLQALVW